MRQGQSIATIDKERCLGAAFTVNTKIIGAKFGDSGYTYWHLDTNAGSGWNADVKVDGSPVVAQLAADRHLRGMRREMFFCDINTDALDALKHRMNSEPEWDKCSHFISGDNENAVQLFSKRLRRSQERAAYMVGMVVIDPNGYWYRNKDGCGAPINSILTFVREFPRIDIVININTRTYRLMHSHERWRSIPSPMEVLQSLNKAYWLVRRTQHGTDEFLLAVGRNKSTGDHRALGFHKLESDEGRHIMTMVTGGRQRQLPLEMAL